MYFLMIQWSCRILTRKGFEEILIKEKMIVLEMYLSHGISVNISVIYAIKILDLMSYDP